MVLESTAFTRIPPLYRPDLPKQITAVGSYFARREAT